MKRCTTQSEGPLFPCIGFAAIGTGCVLASLLVMSASAAKPASAGPNPNASSVAQAVHKALLVDGLSPALFSPAGPALQAAPGLGGQLPIPLSPTQLQSATGLGGAFNSMITGSVGNARPAHAGTGNGNLLAFTDGKSISIQQPLSRISVRVPHHAAPHATHDPQDARQPNGMAQRFLGAGDLYSMALHGEKSGGVAGANDGKGGGKSGDKGRHGGGGGKSWDKGKDIGKGADHPIFTPEDYPLGKWHHFPGGKGAKDGTHVDGWHWGWGGPPIVDPPNGDPPNGDPPNGDPPNGDPPNGDPPNGDPPNGDPPNGDPPNGDPPNGDPPNGDPPNGDPPNGDPPNGDPPNGEDDEAELASALGEISRLSDSVFRDPFATRTLERMGIYIRTLTQDELRRAALGNRELYDSLPADLDAPPSARPISINRLRRASVLRAINLYADIFLELSVDPETGQTIEKELLDEVALALGTAWADFAAQTGGDNPQNFRLFLLEGGEHEQALVYVDGLRELLNELWVMGLTRAEFRHSVGRVLGPVTPDGVSRAEFERAIGVDRIG